MALSQRAVAQSGFSTKNFTTATSFSTLPACRGIHAYPGKRVFKLLVQSFSVDSRKSSSGPIQIRLAYSLDGRTTWN
jgi:hypothetical protein